MGLLDRVNEAHVSHKLKGDARLPDEDFKSYKIRRRKEQRLLKNYMKGELTWYSGGSLSSMLLQMNSMFKGNDVSRIIASAKGTLRGKGPAPKRAV